MGIAGQINLAQVAFFGVGAYATAILTTHGWSRLLARRGARRAGRAGRRAAWSASPRCGSSPTTWASSRLGLALAFLDWSPTHARPAAPTGISGIPAPPLFGVDLSSEYLYYYLEPGPGRSASGFAPVHRPHPAGPADAGHAGRPAGRRRLGAEVPTLRMIAFAARQRVRRRWPGALYAGLIRYVAPETFSIANMFLLLAMVIIGGRHSLAGCVIGAIVLTVPRGSSC